MKEGPAFQNKLTHCQTKNNTEISVTYTCHTGIVNNRAYKKHTDPGTGRKVRNVGWRDDLLRQIEGAITYVFRYYSWALIRQDNRHNAHIGLQIKNCLNENFQNERVRVKLLLFLLCLWYQYTRLFHSCLFDRITLYNFHIY